MAVVRNVCTDQNYDGNWNVAHGVYSFVPQNKRLDKPKSGRAPHRITSVSEE
jgi:hypothetical protein